MHYFNLPAGWLLVTGALSALLGLLAFLPYAIATLKGHTTPHLASWLIWSVLSSIAFFCQWYEGAASSLWFSAAKMSGTLVIFLLAFGAGQCLRLSRADERALWVALIGMVLWYFTDNAAYTLALTITISLLGGTLTVHKAFVDPDSENMPYWAWSFVAACLALLSVGRIDPLLLAYPAYLFVLNGAIILAILLGRHQQNRLPDRAIFATALASGRNHNQSKL